jgi:SSS family solute:Na+ symporter
MLAITDIIIILTYVVFVFGVTIWAFRNKSSENFLIAERKLGVFQTMATINASKTGSILLLYTALLYAYGFSAVWYFIGVSAGYLLFIPFAKKIYSLYGKEHYTLSDYFYTRFGALSGNLATGLTTFTMFAWLVLNLIASSKVISFFTGISFELSILIVSIIVLGYLLIGGFKSVVITDTLQYVAIICILAILAVSFFTATNIPAQEWALFNAGPVNIFGFFLLGILLTFSGPDVWQRVYAAKNVRTLSKGIFCSIFVYLFVALLLSIVGLSVKSLLPGVDPDIALIQGFSQLLPAGLLGFGVVIFFAAFMSSIDTYVYTASSTIVRNFFKKEGSKSIVSIRWVMLGVIVVSAFVAIILRNLVIGAFIFAGFALLLSIPIIASWIRPSLKSLTVSISLVFSICMLIIFVVMQIITQTLNPALVLIAISFGVIGLLIGGGVSFLRSKFQCE